MTYEYVSLVAVQVFPEHRFVNLSVVQYALCRLFWARSLRGRRSEVTSVLYVRWHKIDPGTNIPNSVLPFNWFHMNRQIAEKCGKRKKERDLDDRVLDI